MEERSRVSMGEALCKVYKDFIELFLKNICREALLMFLHLEKGVIFDFPYLQF